MSLTRQLRTTRAGIRTTSWRDRGDVAHLVALRPPTTDRLRRECRRLHRAGVQRVVTGAMGRRDQLAFLDLGFEVVDRLHLLSFEISEPLPLPAPPGIELRTRRWRLDDVLAVDQAAFPDFWQLTRHGLVEARRATPTRILRVLGGRPCEGYSLTGRSGSIAYLQRLAVDPAIQGRGAGRALTLDALAWARSEGCTRMLVNTQVTNERALGLYESIGFELQPEGLEVLARDLPLDSHA